MSKDWLWIIAHFEDLVIKYSGKYIAVFNEEIIADGTSRKEVKNMAKEKYPGSASSIFLVPKEESLECLL